MNKIIPIIVILLALLIFASNTTYLAKVLNYKIIGLIIFLLLSGTLLSSYYSKFMKSHLPTWFSEKMDAAEKYLAREQHHIVLYSLLIVLILYIKTIPTLSAILPIQLLTLLLGVIGAVLFKLSYKFLVGIGMGFVFTALIIYLSGYPLWADRAGVYGYGFLIVSLFQMIKDRNYR